MIGRRLITVAMLLGLAGGCRQWMADQPLIEPLEANAFFPDYQGARHPVPGTIPRGRDPQHTAQYSQHYLTGMETGRISSRLPDEVTERREMAEVLRRGHERYDAYCAHCHDSLGTGNGMVPQRGFPFPPSLHSDRLRQVPLGHIFQVITHGKGRMPPHRSIVPVPDRWAIAAYVRTLQFSQYVLPQRLTPQDHQKLDLPDATARP